MVMRKKEPPAIVAVPIIGIKWESLNQRLISLALCVFIVATVALFVMIASVGQELHQLRIEVSAQGGALRTTIDITGIRIESRLHDLHQSAQVLQKRADEGLTDLRSTVKASAAQSQTAATKQLKSTTEVLKDQLKSTEDAVVGAVEQNDTKEVKPPIVQVTPQAPVVIPIPPSPIPPPPAVAMPRKRQGPFHKFWSHVWK